MQAEDRRTTKDLHWHRACVAAVQIGEVATGKPASREGPAHPRTSFGSDPDVRSNTTGPARRFWCLGPQLNFRLGWLAKRKITSPWTRNFDQVAALFERDKADLRVTLITAAVGTSVHKAVVKLQVESAQLNSDEPNFECDTFAKLQHCQLSLFHTFTAAHPKTACLHKSVRDLPSDSSTQNCMSVQLVVFNPAYLQ